MTPIAAYVKSGGTTADPPASVPALLNTSNATASTATWGTNASSYKQAGYIIFDLGSAKAISSITLYNLKGTAGTTVTIWSDSFGLDDYPAFIGTQIGSTVVTATATTTTITTSTGTANRYIYVVPTETSGDNVSITAGTMVGTSQTTYTPTPLYEFTGSRTTTASGDGADTIGALLYNSYDGYFYGTSEYGGSYSNAGSTDGTIYRFGPPQTYKKTYFTTVNTAVPLSIQWSDLTWTSVAGVSETAYSVNGGATATTHGSFTAGTLSSSTVPASPITGITWTPTTSFTGVDTFTYTVSNTLGTSPAVYGTTTIYVGGLTPNYTLLPTTAPKDTYADLTVTGESSDTTLTYTWSTTGTPPAPVVFSQDAGNTHGGQGTNGAQYGIDATFTKIGTYNFQCIVTAPDGTSTTLTLTIVVPNTGSAFSISPTSATVEIGGTVQFAAGATDQFGNVSGGGTFSNTGVGSVNAATGLYTAPAATAGTAVVTATGGGTASANVTVTSTAPTIVSATASPNPVTTTTTTLTATANYVGTGAVTYTWSYVSGPTGSVIATPNAASSTVTFTQAGTYVYQVIAKNPAGTASAPTQVTVTVNQTATALSVTPTATNAAPLNLAYAATQQLNVTGTDQFGNAIAASSVTWVDYYYDVAPAWTTIEPISSTGLYTAILPSITYDGTNSFGNDYVYAKSGAVKSNKVYINIADPSGTGYVNGIASTSSSPLTIYTANATATVVGYNAAQEAITWLYWIADTGKDPRKRSRPRALRAPIVPTYSSQRQVHMTSTHCL